MEYNLIHVNCTCLQKWSIDVKEGNIILSRHNELPEQILTKNVRDKLTSMQTGQLKKVHHYYFVREVNVNNRWQTTSHNIQKDMATLPKQPQCILLRNHK